MKYTNYLYVLVPCICIAGATLVQRHNSIKTPDSLTEKPSAYAVPSTGKALHKENEASATVTTQERGYFQDKGISMPIVGSYVLWDAENKTLDIFQTPTELTDQDKAALTDGESDYLVFFRKESPNTKLWPRYPFVKTTLKFKTSDISRHNISHRYIYAYGIGERDSNINLSHTGDTGHGVQSISYDADNLQIKYSGNKKMYSGSQVTWRIDI